MVIDKECVKGMSYVFAVKVKQNDSSDKSLINSSLSGKQLKFKSSFAKAKPIYVNGKRVVTPEKISATKGSINSYDNCEPFLNIEDDYSKKVSFENTPYDLFDSENSRIVKGSFKNYSKAECKKAAAHHTIVTPSFLIIVEYTLSESRLVKELLYRTFDIRNFTWSNPSNQCSSGTNKTKTGNITLEKFKALFEKELAANHQDQIGLIKHKFNVSVKSFMQQLQFQEDVLSITSKNDKLKYKAEKLKTSNEDYKFLIKALKYTGKDPNIRYIFKINSDDKTEKIKNQNSPLYFQEIKAHKVLNVLKSGYPKDEKYFGKNCNKEDCVMENAFRSESCSCYSSAFLSEVIQKGASHCEIDQKVENLSFVFVASRKRKINLD